MIANVDISRQFREGMAGNCNVCRRKDYCSHECRNHRDRVEHLFELAFASTKAGQILNAMYHSMGAAYN